MEKILYSKFENIGDIMEELKKKLKPKQKSKEMTLFLMWNDIAGSKLAGFSRPISLKNKTLMVVCKNSLISQELYLSKAKILKSVQFYADSLKLKVDDIYFSYENWEKYNNENEEVD